MSTSSRAEFSDRQTADMKSA